jgi:type IV secretion system protein VirB10
MGGTLIPGVLLTGINSDLPGQILGQVSQSVYDTVSGAYLLVPQGARLIGKYDSRIVYGQERVLIVWTRLIMPNGRSISLEGMSGTDLSGYAGLTDKVNNHWDKILTGVIFSSLLGAGAQLADGRNFNTFDPSYDELALQGFARTANQVGQQITQKNLNIQPTLEIRPGFRFNVFVHKDMVLEPYRDV